MKKVSVAQLKKNTHKILRNVPVIVKSGTVNKYVILPYEEHITPTIQDIQYQWKPGYKVLPVRREVKSTPTVNDLADSVYFQPSPWQKLKRLFIVEDVL